MTSRSRREIAAVFFQNELDIEKARKKIERKIAENKLLAEKNPFLKPMRGHLKEKKGEGEEEGRDEQGTTDDLAPGPTKKRKVVDPAEEEKKKNIRDIKRWRNQIRMKMAAGKRLSEDFVRQRYIWI